MGVLMFSTADSKITITSIDAYLQTTAERIGRTLAPVDVTDPEPWQLSTLASLRTGNSGEMGAKPGSWRLRTWPEVPGENGPVRQRVNATDIQEVVLVYHYTVTQLT
jgi:hypothetical protein